jgi:hypothetical protein
VEGYTNGEFVDMKTRVTQVAEWAQDCPERCPIGGAFKNYVRLLNAFEKLLEKYEKLLDGDLGKNPRAKINLNKGALKMAKFDFFKWVGIATQGVMQMLSKTRDGDFTLLEGLDVAESTIRTAIPEANAGDFARFGPITSQSELDGFEYQDGDILIVIPVELAGKLKYEFNQD